MSNDALKVAASQRALEYVESGMRLGLGTGSTAAKFVDLLGQKVAGGLDVVCVATSAATQAQAEALGIRMTTLDDLPFLDLTVDGADELDGELRLIKGGGGALLREKIVATASGRMIVIADASKRVDDAGRLSAAPRGRALRPDGDPQHDHRARRRRRLRGRDPRAHGCQTASRSSPTAAISFSIAPSAASRSRRSWTRP